MKVQFLFLQLMVFIAIQSVYAQNFVDPATGSVTPGISLPSTYQLEFSDEFDDNSLNTDKWTVNVSTTSRAARPDLSIDDWWWVSDNVKEENGNLVLDVDKFDANTMHCGSVYTNDKYERTYGYYEVRIKIAEAAKGTHTAFWFQGDNMSNVDGTGQDGAEIDVFESAWVDNYTKSVVHIDGYGADHQASTKQYNTPGIHDGGYHTWGFLWEADKLSIYYDGTLSVTYTDAKWIPQVDEYIWLSDGASFGISGDYFTSQPVGYLTSAYVDYIRVWRVQESSGNSSMGKNHDFYWEADATNKTGTLANIDKADPANTMNNSSDWIVIAGAIANQQLSYLSNTRQVLDGYPHSEPGNVHRTSPWNGTATKTNNIEYIRRLGNQSSSRTYYMAMVGSVNTLAKNAASTFPLGFANLAEDGITRTWGPRLLINPVEVQTAANSKDANFQLGVVKDNTAENRTFDSNKVYKADGNSTGDSAIFILLKVTTDGDVGNANDQIEFYSSKEFPSSEPEVWDLSVTSGSDVDINAVFIREKMDFANSTPQDHFFDFNDLRVADSWEALFGTIYDNNGWSLGLPDKTKDAVIASDLTVSENLKTRNLVIKEGATLTIAANVTVNVLGDTTKLGTLVIEEGGQLIIGNVPVTAITLTTPENTSQVTVNTSVQMSATVMPQNATEQSVTWSVTNGTGVATISESGLLQCTAIGTVTVIATANDDSGVSESLELTIVEPSVAVTSIAIAPEGNVTSLNQYESLQFIANVIPENASNKTVEWSITNGTGVAEISATGLVTANQQGTVTVIATAKDGSDVSGTFELTIIEPIPVSTITISGDAAIDNFGYANYTAEILPNNAYDKTFTWSIVNESGIASVTTNGTLVAHKAGTVKLLATANDGSETVGELLINIEAINADYLYRTEAEFGLLETFASVNNNGACSNVSGEGWAKLSDSEFAKATFTNVYVDAAGTYDLKVGYFATEIITNGVPQQVLLDMLVNSTDWSDKETITFDAEGYCQNVSTASLKTITIALNQGVNTLAFRNTGLVEITEPLLDYLEIYESTSLVTSIIIQAEEEKTEVKLGDQLQFIAIVQPESAIDKSVTWSVLDGSGSASITEEGLLTATAVGEVTVKAIANDGSNIASTYDLTILPVLIESITIATSTNSDQVVSGNTLQFLATILPENATDDRIIWRVENGTGTATIDANTGLLSALTAGTVTVFATAQDDSGIEASMEISIVSQAVFVQSIIIVSEESIQLNETLQFSVTILPENATNRQVSWSVNDGSGSATISVAGLLSPTSVGTITVVATALDGSGITGSKTIEILPIPVASIVVSPPDGETMIPLNASLQFSATVLPEDAGNPNVSWSVTNVSGAGTITSEGVFTATGAGEVTIIASAMDDSGVIGEYTLMVIVPVESITISSQDNISSLFVGQTLQFLAVVGPTNTTNPAVSWSVQNLSGMATINSSGLLTATSTGIVEVVATSVENATISSNFTLEITQPVTSIEVTAHGGLSTIYLEETLQFDALITPSNASDQSVTWTVEAMDGQASINDSGLLTPQAVGTVKVIATANDGSGVTGYLELNILEKIIPVGILNLSGTTLSKDVLIIVSVITDLPVDEDQSVDVILSNEIIDYCELSPSSITISNGETTGSITLSLKGENTNEMSINGAISITNPTDGLILGDPKEIEITVEAIQSVLSAKGDINQFGLFPNPFVNTIHIRDPQGMDLMQIMDLGGKIYKSIKPVSKTIEIGEIPDGVYIIKVIDTDGIEFYLKVVRQSK